MISGNVGTDGSMQIGVKRCEADNTTCSCIEEIPQYTPCCLYESCRPADRTKANNLIRAICTDAGVWLSPSEFECSSAGDVNAESDSGVLGTIAAPAPSATDTPTCTELSCFVKTQTGSGNSLAHITSTTTSDVDTQLPASSGTTTGLSSFTTITTGTSVKEETTAIPRPQSASASTSALPAPTEPSNAQSKSDVEKNRDVIIAIPTVVGVIIAVISLYYGRKSYLNGKNKKQGVKEGASQENLNPAERGHGVRESQRNPFHVHGSNNRVYHFFSKAG